MRTLHSDYTLHIIFTCLLSSSNTQTQKCCKRIIIHALTAPGTPAAQLWQAIKHLQQIFDSGIMRETSMQPTSQVSTTPDIIL
jgi:hypothetical protein